MRKKIIITVFIAILLILISNIVEDKLSENVDLSKVNKEALNYFAENCKYEEIITYAEEDVNNDNKKDLVIIYKKDNKSNEMVVVVTNDNNYYTTIPVLAPKEEQVITFKNIDNKDEIEVMVSGSKNGNMGYAIYRVEGEKFIDLFGEGMESCC